MLTWLLFYTSLFEVHKTPQLDITDPGGIVRSQVVETEDGALRIALNASQSHRTQSSRFLAEYFGSGVQHIAFQTEDIVATAAKLKGNGIETLAIPEKLYTKNFKDLFFLEIVERRGYEGFGAINAPIRLNAQSRLTSDAASGL
jgi:4-hydroxyphenylpyruvate dioxygenase